MFALKSARRPIRAPFPARRHLPSFTPIPAVSPSKFSSPATLKREVHKKVDTKTNKSPVPEQKFSITEAVKNQNEYAGVYRLISAYRQHGHFHANIDPLGYMHQLGSKPFSACQSQTKALLNPERFGLSVESKQKIPLEGLLNMGKGKTHATLEEILQFLKGTYTNTTGYEFSHLIEEEEVEWFAKKVEQSAAEPRPLSKTEKKDLARLLIQAEMFDHFMARKMASVKRYGLEGNESMLPGLNAMFQTLAENGATDVVVAMPHRGRLNFLVSLLDYPIRALFHKIKGNNEIPDGVFGSGDVLSHIGQSVNLKYSNQNLHVSLIHNPSHLEAAVPVAVGKVRAKQFLQADAERKRVVPLLIHGDASVAGQGIISETLQMAKLPGFTVAGSIHLIVNNQLGFTTDSTDGRSTPYSSDVGKLINAPVIHVNTEFPEDVIRAFSLAAEYRQTFGKDVFIDLIGYRRHGHNELDDPTFTQPVMYQRISNRPSVVAQYLQEQLKLSTLTEADINEMKNHWSTLLNREFEASNTYVPVADHLKGNWSSLIQGKDCTENVDTGVSAETLKLIASKSGSSPNKVHERLAKVLSSRNERILSDQPFDWAAAESLAFGSLLLEGNDIRISGQDVGRGTFSQRHLTITDQATNTVHIPLNHLSEGKQGRLQVCNSFLSEFAVLGFEYGYSWEDPNCLPIWEAQFGDFYNGAQIIIDQFVATSEAKWLRQSGLVMLLPHGFDGAGPEHSSCHMERFLQNCCAEGVNIDLTGDTNVTSTTGSTIYNTNMIVINPTTPANYFHALRRQLKRKFRKPLIVVGPKTLLRHAQAMSTLSELTPGTHFLPVIGDSITQKQPESVNEVVFCSGKVYYDLVQKREAANKEKTTAILRIEELCPFPFKLLLSEIYRYPNASSFVWFQEEHQNMGPWWFVQPRLNYLLQAIHKQLYYIGRDPLGPTAVGVSTLHKKEEEQLFLKMFPK